MSVQANRKIGVAIVAPSGFAVDEAGFHRGVAALQSQGCEVHCYYDPVQKHQRFGGTDDARIAQLYAAAENPAVQVVLALRGGYGLSRLLPKLDFARLAASGKLFVGHSDFTAFSQALLAQTGSISFSGPMLCDDFSRADPSEYTQQDFWRCITSGTHTIGWETTGNPQISVSGKLWGGNLSMLASLIGTPWLPQLDGGILFVEDINEHPYRIERLLLQLLHAGVLSRQKALILGDFSGYRRGDNDNGYDFNAMLGWLRKHLPLPIITCLPFGHIRDKVTLPVGCDAQLELFENKALLGCLHYPCLTR
ncbi:MAG: ldcA [Burkholderiaceae bacterium]|nr:ldcA [Burkholderiaceae bacterium]